MSQEDLIKKFDKIFKTNFNKKDRGELDIFFIKKKKELDITNLTADKFLLLMVYIYLEEKNFSINGNNKIEKVQNNVELELKKLFKKPLVLDNKNFILIVTKKIKENEVYAKDLFKSVEAYEGSDLIYFNRKNKILTFTKGDAAKEIKKLINENKISFQIQKPKEIAFDPIDKLLRSDKIDIFEIEFRSLNFDDIRDLYIKIGSKATRINKKVKEIRDAFMDKKLVRVSNVKKIHVGLKNKGREISASLIVTNLQKLGVFRIKWRGKPPIELDKFIRINVLKDLLDVDLIDKDVPITERIISLIGKEIRKDIYVANFKSQLEKWDKYNLLEYKNYRLEPNYNNFKNLLHYIFKEEFLIKKCTIKVDNKKLKGIMLTQIKGAKELFLMLNKRKLNTETLKLLNNKNLPLVLIDFKNKNTEDSNRYNFLDINEHGLNKFFNFIRNVCENPSFFKNEEKYFFEATRKLKNIENILNKYKDNQKKGIEWEETCTHVLNFVFRKTFKLSGPYLPDGITFFNLKSSFLWDSKALFSKKLIDSIATKKTKTPKDIAYIEVFKKKFKINHYIFLTSGVNEESFYAARNVLSNYKKDVNFCCLTDRALSDLCIYFSDKNKATIFHKNIDKFSANLSNILKKGYVDSIKFNEIATGISELHKIDKNYFRKEIKKVTN